MYIRLNKLYHGEGCKYMAKQMSFNLPEIDREATKKAVEDILEKARFYKQVGFVRKEVNNTPSYEPRLHGNTYKINKPAEDVATWNVEHEKMYIEIIDKVEKSVNRLSFKERTIIKERYLLDDDVYDYIVFNELGYSERQYYRIKSRAFYKLAFMMKLEVYK